MKNGICPKCNGNEVYWFAGSGFANEALNLTKGFIAKGTWPDKYVCVGCGYLEYYLPSPDDLQVVREKWERVKK
jgi:hypothetical protein